MPLAGAKCSVSIGIAIHDRADFALMYHQADVALYQRKEDGKGRLDRSRLHATADSLPTLSMSALGGEADVPGVRYLPKADICTPAFDLLGW